MVARSDYGGLRKVFVDECIKSGIQIKCPSSLCNNDKTDIRGGPSKKMAYIKNFIFNACPENSFADGYCTEKLFQAIYCGCIPIYWGDPENESFFNKERIIYCHGGAKNTIPFIKELLKDDVKLEKMFLKPLFNKNALTEIDKYVAKFDAVVDKWQKFRKCI